jgi:hypothetical protein
MDEIIGWIYKDMSVYQSYFVGTNVLCLAFGAWLVWRCKVSQYIDWLLVTQFTWSLTSALSFPDIILNGTQYCVFMRYFLFWVRTSIVKRGKIV